jgi:hypothetical protein
MANLKEELIKVTEEFDVVKALNEAKLRPLKGGLPIEPKTTQDIAAELKISDKTVYRSIKIGMSRLYDDLKKQLKANPAQIMKWLMDFFNTDAEQVMSYLSAEKKEEVRAYVKEHGVY